MRKLLQKQASGTKKAKKGVVIPAAEENKLTVGLIYVNEQFDGWKQECLRILTSKCNVEKGSFASDQEILEALNQSAVGQASNFKQIQMLCMPFLRFKEDETLSIGPQALDLKLPFGEIQVLLENHGSIKRQHDLEHIEILSATDDVARSKAGPYISFLNQNPPSPGSPAIFLGKLEYSTAKLQIGA